LGKKNGFHTAKVRNGKKVEGTGPEGKKFPGAVKKDSVTTPVCLKNSRQSERGPGNRRRWKVNRRSVPARENNAPKGGGNERVEKGD